MRERIDLTGKRFGRLFVLSVADRKYHLICVCDCGNKCTVAISSLKSGSTQSCGCLRLERSKTHGMSHIPEFRVWNSMLERCNNPNNKRYCDYGGRGIKVCERWMDFKNFIADMGFRPKGLTLERINNDKGYSPSNCKWDTGENQARNRRIRKASKTGINGLSWDKLRGKYRAKICVNYKCKHLGLFVSIDDAKEARRQGEIKYWGKERGL